VSGTVPAALPPSNPQSLHLDERAVCINAADLAFAHAPCKADAWRKGAHCVPARHCMRMG